MDGEPRTRCVGHRVAGRELSIPAALLPSLVTITIVFFNGLSFGTFVICGAGRIGPPPLCFGLP